MNESSKIPAPPKMTALEGGVEAGIRWAVVQAPLYGAINGYVEVPEGHVWFGRDYDDIDAHAHGGLTFAHGGWIGFDTLHAGDVWPDSPSYVKEIVDDWTRYWTQEQVVEEAKNLARQVAAADPTLATAVSR